MPASQGIMKGVLDRDPRTTSRPSPAVIGPVEPIAMPSVRKIQASSTRGCTQRAQVASMRPSIRAATAKEKEIESRHSRR